MTTTVSGRLGLGSVVLAYYRKTARTDLPIGTESLEWLDRRFEAIQPKAGDTFD